jgi:hypothetical protein
MDGSGGMDGMDGMGEGGARDVAGSGRRKRRTGDRTAVEEDDDGADARDHQHHSSWDGVAVAAKAGKHSGAIDWPS